LAQRLAHGLDLRFRECLAHRALSVWQFDRECLEERRALQIRLGLLLAYLGRGEQVRLSHVQQTDIAPSEMLVPVRPAGLLARLLLEVGFTDEPIAGTDDVPRCSPGRHDPLR